MFSFCVSRKIVSKCFSYGFPKILKHYVRVGSIAFALWDFWSYKNTRLRYGDDLLRSIFIGNYSSIALRYESGRKKIF